MINSLSRGITLPALPMYLPGVFKRPAMVALTAGAIALAGCAGDQTGLGLSLVPEEQVEQMGLQTWQKLRSETPASQNRSYQQRLDRVATRILAAAGENPKAWEAVVFKGDQVNAFALPGGKIGFYEGMMELAESDAELAAVVGHEIAHNQEKHAVERVNSQAATQLGVGIAAAALGGQQANAVAGILNAGAQYGVLLPYGRNQELESDRQGLKYMARAGYNPNAAVTFWQKMASQSTSRPPAFASTHPAPEQRIAQIKEMLPEARSIYQANR